MTTPKAKLAGLALIAALCGRFMFGMVAPAWADFDRRMVREFNETAQGCGLAVGVARVLGGTAVSPFLIPNFIEAARSKGASKDQLRVIRKSLTYFAAEFEPHAREASGDKRAMWKELMELFGTYCEMFISGHLKRVDAIPMIVESLSHGDWRVRRMAAETLGAFGSAAKDAVPALKKVLTDENDIVRSTAAKALEQIQE